MTLRIQRSVDDGAVIFALSGRIEAKRVVELQCLLASERADHRIVLDLQGIDLVDRETVKFPAQCAEDGITFEHCPAYIREWILREKGEK